MKIVDANVLLYAVNPSSARHETARTWLESALTRDESVGFAWTVILAFARISTRPGLFPRPLSSDQAVATARDWLSQPPAVVVGPTTRHLLVLGGFLADSGTGGNLVNDAHLAALAIEHDGEVVSYDTDFARFDGLRWSKPG